MCKRIQINLTKFYHFKLVEIFLVFFRLKKKNFLILNNFSIVERKKKLKYYQKLRKNFYIFQGSIKKQFIVKKFKIKSFFWFGELVINKNTISYVKIF